MYVIQSRSGSYWTGTGWTVEVFNAKFYACDVKACDDFYRKNRIYPSPCGAAAVAVDESYVHKMRLRGNTVFGN